MKDNFIFAIASFSHKWAVSLALVITLSTQGFAASSLRPATTTKTNRVFPLCPAVHSDALLTSGQLSEAMRNKIERFVDGLPRTTQVRTLQARAHTLTKQLKASRNVAQQQRVLTELAALETKLDQDCTHRALTKLLARSANQRHPAVTTLFTNATSQAGSTLESGVIPGVLPPPDFSLLQRGDVLLKSSGSKLSFLWSMTYSHAGIYDGQGWVYESNALTGVQRRPLSEWQGQGELVALGRCNGVTAQSAEQAVDWAEQLWGVDKTEYNYWYANKVRTDKLYCSQLVWQIFRHLGIETDSNDIGYLTWAAARYGKWVIPYVASAIAPDELRASEAFTFYAEGANN